MNEENINLQLQQIGLNQLEAKIYLTLYCNPHITGYKIAQLISKPVANTYKTLQKLEKKGLILCSEYENNKLYDPIELEEYLNRLEHEFKQKKEGLLQEIKHYRKPEKKFSSFALQDLTQVYEKAKTLISQARHVLLVDAFPRPFKSIFSAYADQPLKEKKIKLYHELETDLENAIISFNKDDQMQTWKAQWLIVSQDAKESLIVAVTHDGSKLIHAVYTTDPFLSFIIYNGLANEFMLVEILNKMDDRKKVNYEQIERIHEHYLEIFNYELIAGNQILKFSEET